MAGGIDYFTLFSNVTSFGYFMHLGKTWAIDGIAKEAQKNFTGSIADALNLMYASDSIIGSGARQIAEAMDKVRVNSWDKFLKVGLMLLPLVIILCMVEYFQSGAPANAGSVMADVFFRKFVIRMVVCTGIAISSFFLTRQILRISAGAANQLLTIGGVSFREAGDLVPFLFPNNMLEASLGAINPQMEIVLLFVRVLFVLMLYLVIIFTALANNLAITILIIIAPLIFIISIYSDLSWVRDTWIKTFIGCVFIPVIDAILLGIIISFNRKLPGSMSLLEVLEGMLFSIGVVSVMFMIHESILSGIFKSMADGVGTVKATVQKIAKLVSVIVTKGASLKGNAAGDGNVKLAKALRQRKMHGDKSKDGNDSNNRRERARNHVDKLLRAANDGSGRAQKIKEGEAEKRVKNSSDKDPSGASMTSNISDKTRRIVNKNSSRKAAEKHRLGKAQANMNDARVDIAMDKLEKFVKENGYSSIDDYGQKHGFGNNYSLKLADELYDAGGYYMHPMAGNEDAKDSDSPLETYGQGLIWNMYMNNDTVDELDDYLDGQTLD